ncbi:MAG: hypothetical protein CMG55_05670 [Candidatus Marinimicrobia bacterium]|nr:hypothetical protein [Candidatus Neomarinimicrobiota bacterium]|tara:strand:+ start:11870 stop:14848 length:2979 start_codon:yes stop_codon:yes gene_type:complete
MIHPNYISINRVFAGITFLISFIVYFDTMAPTVSYWDCGEFIAVSYTLGVPHPPGSPLFLLLGRIASMLPISEDIAFRVNLMSPLVSAFAVMFLYLIIVKVVNHWRGKIESTTDALISFGAGVVGSLTFAFTDSHWFNAVEAEVYAFSTFFTAIVVWLILIWSEKADNRGHERYILIIAYMIGLATGLHLLNLLTLPFVALIIYFRKYNFEWISFGIMVVLTGLVFFIIHNVIIKGMPKIADSIGVLSTGLLIIAVFAGMVWAIINQKQLMSVLLTSLVLVLIGYSTYALIFIRSNQDPGIDENDPETVEAFISYLEREQYGDVGLFPRRFKGIKPIHEVVGYPEGPGRKFSPKQESDYRSHQAGKQWAFFWDYQVRKMYNRYFLWQFAGRGPSAESGVISMGANNREDGIDITQFGLPLAFILGVIGMLYHGYRDEKMAFSVMALFIMTGYAIILYLNQDNPQPRERDYSYVGSFFAFSIWIGAGTAAISEWISKSLENKDLSKRLIIIALVLQIVFVPTVMARANYHSHDRSGNFVAWDYSYNILQSCGPNGIIFTNGDNDTFPLWYLQEVEKVRTDVAVVNLSLLNTPWYIKQWRDKRPKQTKFINLSDPQIDKLTSTLQQWKTRTVQVPVYNDPENKEGYIEWEMKPTYAGQALRVQDMMIMKIIDDAAWRVPIYFAVTVSQQNRIGLDQYLDMQGLTFQLKSHKTKPVDTEKMFANLMTDIGEKDWSINFDHDEFYDYNKEIKQDKLEQDNGYINWSRDYQPGYMFRNLGNEKIFYNKQTKRLLQNYRSAYMQLAVTYYMEYQRKDKKKKNRSDSDLNDLKNKIIQVLDKMEKNIPSNVIPIQSEDLHYQVARIYGDLEDTGAMRKILENLVSRINGRPLNRVEYANTFYKELGDTEKAINILEDMRGDYLRKESMVSVRGFSKETVKKGEWSRWQKAYPEIISSLVYIYRENNQLTDAEIILSEWVNRNPSDGNAKKILEEVRSGE